MSVRVPLLALAFALIAAPARAYDFGLGKVTDVFVDLGTYDVKTADLNGDGIPDAVTAQTDAQHVAVAFGTLTGLAPPVFYATGPGHSAAVDLADFDGNGSIDIAEADWNENRVRLWLNLGNGTFALGNSYTVASNPRDLASGDFDGNGTRDLAVGTGDGKVVILSGTGGGAFAPSTTLSPLGVVKGVAAGDLDNDGDIDLVAVDSSNWRLFRFRNLGGMRFGEDIIAALQGSPSDVALGDLDGDGFLDAAASLENNKVAVLQGSASDFLSPWPFPIGTLSQSVTIADFDGVNGPDLLVSNYGDNTVQVLRNQGALKFGDAYVTRTGTGPRSAAAADFNGDGRMDVVSGDFYGTVTRLDNIAANPKFTWLPSTLDFGSFGQGATTVRSLQLKNLGTTPLKVTPGAIDGAEFEYAGSSAPLVIAPATTAVLNLRYLRLSLGTATGTLHLASNDTTAANVEIPLTGVAVAPDPEVAFSPASLDYGSSYVGNPGLLYIYLTNSGNAPVLVTPGAIDGTGFVYATSNAPVSVQPGVQQAIGIKYKRPVVGDATGTVHLSTDDPDHPELLVPCTGNAIASLAKATYNPHSLDFGGDIAGVTTLRTVTFTNAGTQNMIVTPGAIEGAGFSYSGSGAAFTLTPGNGGSITLRMARSAIGTSTGTLNVQTTDPDQVEIAIPLTGKTVVTAPRITCTPLPLDFGSAFNGVQQALSVTVKNSGYLPLSVTPGAIDGDQFTYDVGGASAFTLAVGTTQTIAIRYLRSVTGPATGMLHLATNDPDEADFKVALAGIAAPPPIASFSSPSPITVNAGTSAPASVVVRNSGPSALTVQVPSAVGDVTEATSFDAGPTSQDFWRLDPTGALWNVDWEGRVVTGANDEYHWGMDEANFIAQGSGTLGLGGRELRLGPVAVAPGVNVTRKIYVPETGGWVRFIDVAENPADVPRTATFDLFDNIGYVPQTAIFTSDGDAQFELNDDWIVIPNDQGRSVGRLFRSGAANVPVLATWFQTTVPGCYSRTKFVSTLQPHARACVIQWAVQGSDAAAAIAAVEALRQNPASGLVHADAIDRATAWNVVPAPQPFRPVATSFSVAPGDSALIPIVFGAEGATHDADLTAVLRLTTNDPAHPVLAVPLAFSIGNGQVVGVTPPEGPATSALELAGFQPNPMRISGTARIAFRLATNEPATLTVYDVAGRQLARRVIEVPEPGPGSLALTGSSLRPGVVWMRLVQGGRVARQKGIVLP